MPRNPSPPPSSNVQTGSSSGDAGQSKKFMVLADVIRSAIERNNFSDNEILPSERELSAKYEVSRDTVRKTINMLEEQGVVYSEHGRGTFVAPEIMRRTARAVEGFSEEASARGGSTGQRILLVKTTSATMALAGLMGLSVGHPLTRVRRVRLIDQQPVGLHDAYLVIPAGVTIQSADLAKHGSLYELLRSIGMKPTEAVDNLSATMADAEEADLLRIDTGTPLLMCERVTLSEHREPLEYCLMKYVPSYRFGTRFSRRVAE